MQGLVNDFRTFNWVQNIRYPGLVYQKSRAFLELVVNPKSFQMLYNQNYEDKNTPEI